MLQAVTVVIYCKWGIDLVFDKSKLRDLRL